ncbi:MAG: glycine cleavage T C-terminal barrel domain-containing protein, partial [Pseudomonadota bacterium]
GSAAASEFHDWDLLHDYGPPDGVTIESLTNSHTTIVLAGPKTRALLADAAPRTEWSHAAFPWLTVQQVFIGHVPASAMAVSFSGEDAFELHIANEFLSAAYASLISHGAAHGLGHFGLFATESMRMEKGYRHWKADLITEFDAYESGLDRFVSPKKSGYVGHEALTERRNAPRRKFVSLRIENGTAPAHPGDSLMLGDSVVGTITSAAYGHRVDENLAMAFVDPDHVAEGTPLQALILGEHVAATVVTPCRYDPENARVKASCV